MTVCLGEFLAQLVLRRATVLIVGLGPSQVTVPRLFSDSVVYQAGQSCLDIRVGDCVGSEPGSVCTTAIEIGRAEGLLQEFR